MCKQERKEEKEEEAGKIARFYIQNQHTLIVSGEVCVITLFREHVCTCRMRERIAATQVLFMYNRNRDAWTPP